MSVSITNCLLRPVELIYTDGSMERLQGRQKKTGVADEQVSEHIQRLARDSKVLIESEA